MLRNLAFVILLSCCQLAFADAFDEGKRHYDELNLVSALTHLSEAEAQLRAEPVSEEQNTRLTQVLLYKAASYFYLDKPELSSSHLQMALSEAGDRQPAAAFLPKALQIELKELREKAKFEREEGAFAEIISLPRTISQQNIERAFHLDHTRAPARQAGQWLTGLSALPLGVGILFAAQAGQSKAAFLDASANGIDASDLQTTWQKQAIGADIGLLLGAAMAVTGIILWTTHYETAI